MYSYPIIGWSPDVPYDEDEELEVAHDKALAEEFDPRLTEEVRRGNAWDSNTERGD